MPTQTGFYGPIARSDLPPLLRLFDSIADLANAIGVTPQAVYIRRSKGLPLVTAEEAATLLRDRNVPLHVSRPDLFPKLRRV